MSQTLTRLPLREAEQLARGIVGTLGPGCCRIEVAGSVRRKEKAVGDIEVVAIPAYAETPLGDRYSLLDAILKREEQASLRRLKGGDRFKQFEILKPHSGDVICKLDLFLALDAACWGVLYTIRTGPAAFSKVLVTRQSYGGLLPDHLVVKDGRVWDGQQALDTPEEEDFFRVLGLLYREPEKRR